MNRMNTPARIEHLETSDGVQLCECIASPNGRYLLAWRDSDGKGCGGARSGGKGRYWLFDDSKEVLRGQLERPNGGCVANSGTFSFEDWLFTQELASVYYIFAVSGEVKLRRRFKANIYNSAISADGDFAVCFTAASDHWKDSNALFLYSGVNGAALWRQVPPFSPAAYEFDSAARTLVIRPRSDECHHQFSSCTFVLPQVHA